MGHTIIISDEERVIYHIDAVVTISRFSSGHTLVFVESRKVKIQPSLRRRAWLIKPHYIAPWSKGENGFMQLDLAKCSAEPILEDGSARRFMARHSVPESTALELLDCIDWLEYRILIPKE